MLSRKMYYSFCIKHINNISAALHDVIGPDLFFSLFRTHSAQRVELDNPRSEEKENLTAKKILQKRRRV